MSDGAEVLATALKDLQRRKVELAYVEYDDQLSEEQIQRCLQGGALDVENEIDEAFWESRANGLDYEIKHLIEDEDERDSLSDEQRETLEQAIRDADTSNPFDELLRRTGRVLLRYRLGKDDDWDVPGESWSWDDTKRHGYAKAILRTLRLDPNAVVKRGGCSWTNLEQATELVENATYGGRLWVIWSGDCEGVVKAAMDDEFGNKTPKLITFTDPRVVLLDNWNGSGHDVQFEGTIVRLWDPERCVTDKGAPGYGWDDVAGLSKGAYAADVTVRSL